MSDTQDVKKMASDTSNPFTSVPIEITVSVGKARPLVRDLVVLGPNAVLPLDKKVDAPVELFVGNKLIARGTLEEAEDGDEGELVVRLTEIHNLQDSF